MAGYMTKLQGYVYEGELPNLTGGPIENGTVLELKLKSGALGFDFASSNGVKMLCKEETTIYDGIKAYRFIVTEAPEKLYFIENGFELNGALEYDVAQYATANGKLLRAHPLLVGEEFVTDKVTGTPAVGTEYTAQADGTIG